MALIIREVTSTLLLTHDIVSAHSDVAPMYGSLVKADIYFGSMLEGQRWAYTDRTRRQQALVSATKRIDRLNFTGCKSDDTQTLQFPRDTDTLVPVDIEYACYELAMALLKGVDPDTEHDNLFMSVQAYGGLRSEYDRTTVPPYVVAGIPCLSAWQYLLPYLAPRTGLEIHRVS